MNDFENELRKALGLKAPSNDFGARVAARLAKQNLEQERRTPQWRSHFRWAVAAMIIVTTAGGFTYYRWQVERDQGEAARQQVVLALRITSEKLQVAQHRVQHLSER